MVLPVRIVQAAGEVRAAWIPIRTCDTLPYTHITLQ
jgi:hypothetical protein